MDLKVLDLRLRSGGVTAAALMAALLALAAIGLSVGTGKRTMGRLKHVVAAALGLAAPAGTAWAKAPEAGAQASPSQSLSQLPSQPLPAPRPAIIGINVADVQYFSSAAPFANLAIGSEWNDTQWRHLPEDWQDRDGNLLSVPADGVATRFLLIPPTGPEGMEVRCTFTGAGALDVRGAIGPARPGPHSLGFRIANERGKQSFPWLIVTGFDPARPLRDLDCRDARLPRTARFRPEFLRFLKGFGVIRFMDWQHTNADTAVPWAERHTPASLRVDRDGVAIEDMLALAREAGADPWFTVPWNADDDYISRFARMVRDALPAGRSVYVEVGNEVWNTGFPVGQQAIKEGLARGLGADANTAGTRRHAQRSAEVMRLWEAAFVGRRGLVRVLAMQHEQPWNAELALSYADTAAHIDALATAPYVGTTLGGTGHTREESLANIETALPVTLAAMTANRRVAAAHGKRYIGYEGGPGIGLPSQTDLLERLQHDPAMHELVARYLAGWARNAGDVLCLYNSVSRPTSWGMFGLAEWENETPAEAPKLRAVREFMAVPAREQASLPTSIAPGG